MQAYAEFFFILTLVFSRGKHQLTIFINFHAEMRLIYEK